MKLLTCARCQSQFDVAAMQPGSTFVCGKCRNVLHVPAAAPIVQPLGTVQPVGTPGVRPNAPSAPPATVVLTPDEMKKALASARAPAPGPAQPKLPAAMEARRQQQATQQVRAAAPAPAATPAPAVAASASATRAAPAARPAAAASAAPAAPAGGARPARAARRREADEGDAPAKKPVALYAGIGGALVLAGVVAFVVSGGGKGSDTGGGTGGGTDVATAPSGGNGTASPAAAGDASTGDASPTGSTTGSTTTADAVAGAAVPVGGDAWQSFLKMPDAERQMFVAQKLAAAQGNAAALKELHDWFTNEKIAAHSASKDAQRRIVEEVLRLDPASDWANAGKGNRNAVDLLKKARESCAKAFMYQDVDEKELTAALERAQTQPWVDPKEYGKLEALVKRVEEREKVLAADPRLEIVEKKKDWTRNNALFKDLKWEYLWSDPYLISQQYDEFKDDSEKHKNKARLEKAKLLAHRDGIIFQEVDRQFRALFAERFSLPTLKEKGRVLVAIITWNRAAFDEVVKRSEDGRPVGPGIRAYYSPGDQRIMHYVGEGMTSLDELPCKGGRIQKMSDQVTFHEGTHQLQHEYSAIYRGEPLRDDMPFQIRMRKSMWFEEGLAEFIGAVEVEKAKNTTLEGATFFHNRILLERVGQVRGDGRMNNHRELAKKWTIKELLGPNHNGDLDKKSEELAPNQGDFMRNLFYARSWGFVHFLWFYDGGKYRKNMLDYIETVLKDQQGPAAFAKCLGRKGPEDWKGIEQEFDWYWDRLLARAVGWRDPMTKTKPWDTDTDPPTGKFDPNADPDDEPDPPKKVEPEKPKKSEPEKPK